jgi:CheY-like chemotaxis protein
MTIIPAIMPSKVLVVDDHLISRTHALNTLQQFARTVRAVGTASESIALALSWFPEAIFMDRHLPDMDGLEAVLRIRTDWPAERKSPRIILITADPTDLATSTLSGLQVDDLVEKPATGAQLRDALTGSVRHGIREEGWDEPGSKLHGIFAEELQQRLPQLDQCMAKPGKKRARDILHQLIASAAICGERGLEKDLRRLDRSLCEDAAAPELAGNYYAVSISARDFMQRC